MQNAKIEPFKCDFFLVIFKQCAYGHVRDGVHDDVHDFHGDVHDFRGDVHDFHDDVHDDYHEDESYHEQCVLPVQVESHDVFHDVRDVHDYVHGVHDVHDDVRDVHDFHGVHDVHYFD